MGKVKSVKSKLKLAKSILEKYENQTCEGYKIKCIDGEFLVNGDCFKFSDFFNEHLEGKSQFQSNSSNFKPWSLELIEPIKARAKFSGKKNNIFDFSAFHLTSVRKVFDLLHGLDVEKITLATAVEIMIFCNYDGKITQKSEFETNLFQTLSDLIGNGFA